ncbi:MAG: hypothetical protein H0U89_12020 [Acidimicrobiia bacterium]|nr:hypothetical protein [Acidimicrobiia bacterium]
MRRVAALLVVVCTLVVTAGAPASAQVDRGNSLNRQASGPFTGTSSFDFGTGTCAFVFMTYDLTFQTGAQRSGTVHIEGCVNTSSVSGGFAFERSSFELTTPQRATLTGTVSGGVFPIDLTLTVTDGTRRFRRAAGTVAVDGTGGPSGPVSGTLTASLARSLRRP